MSDETIDITTGGAVAIEDEGIELTPAVTVIDFAGAGVTATEPSPDEVLVTIPGYTDEQAQDAVGSIIVANTFDVKFVYDDATPTITATAVRVIQILVSDPNGVAITTGDGKAYIRINSILNNWNLTAVAANVITVSSVGDPTIQINNVTQAADMLSTKLTIDAGEHDSKDATIPAVIDLANDDVATGDELRIDIDVAGTGAKGLIVELTFTKP